MATKVIIKKSAVTGKVPLAADLDYGELALNYTDGKLFYKNISDSVSELTTPGAVTLTGTQTLTNKTLTSPAISGGTINNVVIGNTTATSITGTNVTANTALISAFSLGDEGGQIEMARPLTNTTLAGAVVIDIFQNRLRIFENGGTSRGVFVDLAAAAAGAGTNLQSGSGTVTSVAPLTIGTTGTNITSTVVNGTTTPVITLNIPTASATNRGALSSADWNTFNNKTNNTGTVISVNGTGTVSGLTLTGTVTTSGNLTLGGTLAVTANNFASQTTNTVLAAPNGSAGIPTFRALVAADIPTLNQNTTGNAATATTANGLNAANSYTVASMAAVSATGKVALGTDSGGSISLGRTDNSASFPFIDFNSGATLVDYDARITASGGNGVSGNGSIYITAAAVGIGVSTPAYKLEVNGSFAATSKSFVIPHPTQPDKKLRHGSLEGPEHGVYVRGNLKGNIIELPEYWTKLIDPDTITVQLTAIGKNQKLYVENICDNKVYVVNEGIFASEPHCFYLVQAERVDIDKMQVVI